MMSIDGQFETRTARMGRMDSVKVEYDIDDCTFVGIVFIVFAFALGTIITFNVRGCTERADYQWHVEKMASSQPAEKP